MAVTLKDVAREANVSITTVSAVLRGASNPMIGEETQRKVLAIASSMRYRHNIYARSLASGKSNLIGLLTFGSSTRASEMKIDALDRGIFAKGFRSLMRTSGENPGAESHFVNECLSSRAEGLIIVQPSAHMTFEVLDPVLHSGTPVVSLEYIEGADVDCATVDRRWGGYLATKHLLELGHRRVAVLHLSSNPLAVHIYARVEGYKDALSEYGIDLDESLFVQSGPGYSGGYTATKELLSRRTGVTAMFCNNDEIAIGAMKALREAGVRVPDDMALVGFDDVEVASYAPVPLTTIAQPVEEVAQKAIEVLFQKIESPDADTVPVTVSIKPRLVVRESAVALRR